MQATLNLALNCMEIQCLQVSPGCLQLLIGTGPGLKVEEDTFCLLWIFLHFCDCAATA